MKYIYYAFGGFMGFICGTLVSLIFYALEKSGNPVLTNLGRNHGWVGRYLAESVNALPVVGIIAGLLLVNHLFQKKLEPGDK